MTHEATFLATTTIVSSLWRLNAHVIFLEIFVYGVNKNSIDRDMRTIHNERWFVTQLEFSRSDTRVRTDKYQSRIKRRREDSDIVFDFQVSGMKS